MGTDIHLIVEVKNHDGAWEKLGKVFKNGWYNPEKPTVVHDAGTSYEYVSNAEFDDEPWDGRNYNLFAALANVRNGVGFAGVPTGSGVSDWISDDRGIPEDASPESRDWLENHADHSFGWATLEEVLSYDWDRPLMHTGVIAPSQYRALRDEGVQPQHWSGGVSGGGIITLDWDEFDEREREGTLPAIEEKEHSYYFSTNVYVRAHWPAAGGLRGTIGEDWFAALDDLVEKYGIENTRLLFGFDS